MQEQMYSRLDVWKRCLWGGLLVAASVGFSFAFACAMPFAALGAVAACTLLRRDAYYVAGAAWAANQLIGFVFLQYPWTTDCLAWGLALGLAALLCTSAACWTRQRLIRLPLWAGCAMAFAAAFVAWEGAILASCLLLGGIESFTPSIVATVFAINGAALVLASLPWIGWELFLASCRPPLNCARDENRAALMGN